MHRLVGLLAAANGFVVWLVFAIQAGGRVREPWDTMPYWAIGLPLLVAMHVLLGAALRRGTWFLPVCTIAGHLLAMVLVHPPGGGVGMLPMAAVMVGVPFYVALAIAGWAGQAMASLARREV